MMNLLQKEILWEYVESLLDVFITTRKRNQVQSLECNQSFYARLLENENGENMQAYISFKDVITLFISKFINLHEHWEYL